MPNTSETLAAIDQTILDVMDHVGLGDTLNFGSVEGIRGYYNEAGQVEGQNEDAIVFDSPTFNLRTTDFATLGLALEDEVEIEGHGTFRYVGGPHSAGVGRVLILLGQVSTASPAPEPEALTLDRDDITLDDSSITLDLLEA